MIARAVAAPAAKAPAAPAKTAGDKIVQRKCAGCEDEREVQRLAAGPGELFGVSSPSDAAEREADAVASRVASGGVSPAPSIVQKPRAVNRSATGAAQAPSIPWGGGSPLAPASRAYFEPRFGTSFERVQVHTDGAAARSALDLRAEAYTVGQHIYFGPGKYAPESQSGRRLIAHELTHTIQQRSAPGPIMRQDTPQPGGPATPGGGPATPGGQPGPPGGGAQPMAPGAYDGCSTAETQQLTTARTDAAARAGRAAARTTAASAAGASAALQQHFHVDPAASAGAVASINAQFTRMQTGLGSAIRVFCRSAPQPGGGAPAPTHPVEQACRTDMAFSTSCANNDPTATVAICEMALIGMGDPLNKILLHEFAHIACNSTFSITSGGRAGGEVYYNGAGAGRLPGNQSNVLNQADSYAWFAMGS